MESKPSPLGQSSLWNTCCQRSNPSLAWAVLWSCCPLASHVGLCKWGDVRAWLSNMAAYRTTNWWPFMQLRLVFLARMLTPNSPKPFGHDAFTIDALFRSFLGMFLYQKSVAVSFWINMKPFNELLHVCRSPTKSGWHGQKHGICIMALVDDLQASSVLVFYHFLVACLCTFVPIKSEIHGRWIWSIGSIVFMTWKSGRSINRIKLYLEEPSIPGTSVPLRFRNLYISTCISDLASLCRLIASQKRR